MLDQPHGTSIAQQIYTHSNVGSAKFMENYYTDRLHALLNKKLGEYFVLNELIDLYNTMNTRLLRQTSIFQH